MRFIKTYAALFEGKESEDGKKLSCAMVTFEMPLLKALHSVIDPEDLAENGFEDEPHCTLLFGLHQDEINADECMSMMDECEAGPIILGPVSLFTNDKNDVLKFDASGDWMHAINEKLRKLPHTNDYPDYKPHCTLAYLKPGTGEKYAKMFEGLTYQVTPSHFVYSDSERNKTRKKVSNAY